MEEILRKLKAFSDQLVPLPEDAWKDFISGMKPLQLERKEFFLREGEVCDRIGFVGTGAMRAYHIKDGEEITQDFCLDGMYVTNYVSFLTRMPSVLWIEAIEPVDMVTFSRDHLEHLYSCSQLAERMGRRIAESIYVHVELRNQQFLLETPEERYTRLVREFPEVFQRVPQRHIASYLGIKPESLSRIRSRMAKRSGQRTGRSARPIRTPLV